MHDHAVLYVYSMFTAAQNLPLVHLNIKSSDDKSYLCNTESNSHAQKNLNFSFLSIYWDLKSVSRPTVFRWIWWYCFSQSDPISSPPVTLQPAIQMSHQRMSQGPAPPSSCLTPCPTVLQGPHLSALNSIETYSCPWIWMSMYSRPAKCIQALSVSSRS